MSTFDLVPIPGSNGTFCGAVVVGGHDRPSALKSVVTILFGGCFVMKKLWIVCSAIELNTATTSRARTRYKIFSTLVHGGTHRCSLQDSFNCDQSARCTVSSTLLLRAYSYFSILCV